MSTGRLPFPVPPMVPPAQSSGASPSSSSLPSDPAIIYSIPPSPAPSSPGVPISHTHSPLPLHRPFLARGRSSQVPHWKVPLLAGLQTSLPPVTPFLRSPGTNLPLPTPIPQGSSSTQFQACPLAYLHHPFPEQSYPPPASQGGGAPLSLTSHV